MNISPEIISQILAWLHGDRQSLIQYSLAARAFLFEAQKRLFYRVDLDFQKADEDKRLASLCRTVELYASYVRTLKITLSTDGTGVPGFSNFLEIIIAQAHIKRLIVKGPLEKEFGDPEICLCEDNLLKQLVMLPSIAYLKLRMIGELSASTFSARPKFHTVDMGDVFISLPEPHALDNEGILQNLALLTCFKIYQFKTLEFDLIGETDVQAAALIASAFPGIENFHM